MKDYYHILDIPSNASQETIKEQYHLLIHAWVPDKFPRTKQKVKVEEKIKEINEAFNVLSDPVKRRQYDKEYFVSKYGEKDRWQQVENERQQRIRVEEEKRRVENERQQRIRVEEEKRRAEFERQQRIRAEEEKRRAEYERHHRIRAEEERRRVENERQERVRVETEKWRIEYERQQMKRVEAERQLGLKKRLEKTDSVIRYGCLVLCIILIIILFMIDGSRINYIDWLVGILIILGIIILIPFLLTVFLRK